MIEWHAFCFEIVVPLNMKEKMKIRRETGRFPHRLGKAYRIPLIIYPSRKQSLSEGSKL